MLGHYWHAGRLVDARCSRTLQLSGAEVLGRRECTRDAEWRLLRCVLRDAAGSPSAQVLLVSYHPPPVVPYHRGPCADCMQGLPLWSPRH